MRSYALALAVHGRAATRVALGYLVLLACGCDSAREQDAAPLSALACTIHVERSYLDAAGNPGWRPRVSGGFGVANGYSAGGCGCGIGLTCMATTISLIGRDPSTAAEILRREVAWGDTTCALPVYPGQRVSFVVRIDGARERWEPIGSLIVPPAARCQMALVLDASGSHISLQDEHGAPMVLTPEPAAPWPLTAPAVADAPSAATQGPVQDLRP